MVQLKMVKDHKELDKRCCGGALRRHRLLSQLLMFVNGGAAVASHAANPCTSSPCVYLHSQSTPVTHPAAQVAGTLSLMVLHWLIFSHCCQINNHSQSGALASPPGNLQLSIWRSWPPSTQSRPSQSTTPASESAGFRCNRHVTESLCWY